MVFPLVSFLLVFTPIKFRVLLREMPIIKRQIPYEKNIITSTIGYSISHIKSEIRKRQI
jgi:hypothetical protein